MAAQISTGRGVYSLRQAADPEFLPDSLVLTVALERADGVETVAFKVRVARELCDVCVLDGVEPMLVRLKPWLECEFEQTREAALRSVRTEHRLLEIAFDASRPGPFGN